MRQQQRQHKISRNTQEPWDTSVWAARSAWRHSSMDTRFVRTLAPVLRRRRSSSRADKPRSLSMRWGLSMRAYRACTPTPTIRLRATPIRPTSISSRTDSGSTASEVSPRRSTTRTCWDRNAWRPCLICNVPARFSRLSILTKCFVLFFFFIVYFFFV